MSLSIAAAQLVLGTIVHGDAWTVIPDIYLAAINSSAHPDQEPPFNLVTTYGRKFITLNDPVLGADFYSGAEEWQARATLPTWAWHQGFTYGVDPNFTLQTIGVFDSGTRGAGLYLGEFGSTPEAHLFATSGATGEYEIALGPDTDYIPAAYPDYFYAGMARPIPGSTANDALLIDIINAVYRGGSLTPRTLTYIGLLDDSDVEKSYTGYARQPVTFGAPTSGAQCLSTIDVTFVVPPSAVTTTTRWGAYEASSGGSPVLVGTLGSYGNPAIYQNLYTWSAGQIKIQVF